MKTIENCVFTSKKRDYATNFNPKPTILYVRKTHELPKLSTCGRLIKVDLFSVTLHEGADELAFALIK